MENEVKELLIEQLNLTYSTNLPGSRQKCVGQSCPTHWFQHEFKTEMPGVGVSERGACRGTRPTGHGPAGWKLRTKPPNSSASGQAAAKAMRTRVAVSLIRAAILIKRICRVLYSAVASGCSLGILPRTFSSSQ